MIDVPTGNQIYSKQKGRISEINIEHREKEKDYRIHKSMEKSNTPFPSGGKTIVKRLFWFAIFNACIVPFSRSSSFFSLLLRCHVGTKAI